MALEEGPGDPTMLQAQLQDQQTLQAELRASVHQQQKLQLVSPGVQQGTMGWWRPRARAVALNHSNGWPMFMECFLGEGTLPGSKGSEKPWLPWAPSPKTVPLQQCQR